MSSHLDLLLDKERRKVLIEEEAELQHNCEAINTLLDITQTLARQGISFRAEDVTHRVTAKVNQAGMFSVIADTTPDVSHIDQLSVVAQYLNAKGNPQESMIKGCQAKLKEYLGKEVYYHVDVHEKCHDEDEDFDERSPECRYKHH
ncbi:Hypothetical predicted protein [Paramuricea clavata]|uniref:Uncharacterized protein n=1 Tax=Paramuricea clavata TaxID=317549 RepID=A0A7D9DAY6_PARCT|nr:Hypothetical predicted protein [Paramuricea clavata]